MKRILACMTVCLAFLVATSAEAVNNLLVNPGFLDTDGDPNDTEPLGDGWGAFGTVDFNAFFGAGNPHASLFGDNAANAGGFFQQGILGTAGTTYQFDLINTRIESSWDANLQFGVEFYAADDITKLAETKVVVDAATRLALPNVDGGGAVNGAVFSMQATAPAGTVFARPIAQFDTVNFGYVNQPQANSFVFNSFLSEVPAPSGELLKNLGFEDEDGQGDLGDFWGSFGNAGFNDFFSDPNGPANGHASLFADDPNNSGGVFQQSILGTAGKTFEFALLDVRIEQNFAADLSFGLEYYGDDDFTKVSETIVAIDPNTGFIDNNVFVMSGTAPAGTTYVRPVVLFNNVTSTALNNENVFIFDASLVELATTADNADFNGDLAVNGLDFLIWQRGAGSPGGLSMGDANGDGTVNNADLAVWELQYGTTGLLAASASVPEPASFALTLIAVLALVGQGRPIDRRR